MIMRPPKEMRFVVLVDANFATNKDERKSVSGAIYTLGGSIIGWTSKLQGRLAVSTTKAEYYAASIGSQELLFVRNILKELNILKDPGFILTDNSGAIHLIKNRQASLQTKHINTRHHFVQDLWEAKLLEVIHIKSSNNKADICTKNVNTKIHKKHRKNIQNGKLYFNQQYKDMI